MASDDKLTWRDVQRSLAHWKHVLGLDDWEIKLDDIARPHSANDLARAEDDQPRVSAEIDRQPDYKDARIWISPEYRHWTQENLDRTICHELLHCVFREIEWSTDLLQNRIPERTKSFFDSAFLHALEGTIEHLTRRIVEVAS